MKFPPLRGTWERLIRLTTWLSAIVAAFLTLPMKLSLDSSQELLVASFTQFAVATTFGLIMAFGKYNVTEVNKRSILIVATGLFAVLCVVFFLYLFLVGEWTCNYATRFTLVIGSTLSPDATQYLTNYPHLASCKDIIAEYGGATEKVYEKSEILLRFIVLSALYTLLWLICASVVLLVAWGLTNPRTRESDIAKG